jgi:hypothetical protein
VGSGTWDVEVGGRRAEGGGRREWRELVVCWGFEQEVAEGSELVVCWEFEQKVAKVAKEKA